MGLHLRILCTYCESHQAQSPATFIRVITQHFVVPEKTDVLLELTLGDYIQSRAMIANCWHPHPHSTPSPQCHYWTLCCCCCCRIPCIRLALWAGTGRFHAEQNLGCQLTTSPSPPPHSVITHHFVVVVECPVRISCSLSWYWEISCWAEPWLPTNDIPTPSPSQCHYSPLCCCCRMPCKNVLLSELVLGDFMLSRTLAAN